MKASDVFNQTEFVFGKKVSFKEAFPQIKNLNIKAIEQKMMSETLREYNFNMNNLPGEYVDCSNKFCYNGGCSIGDILREMVYQKKTHGEYNRCCQGYEGSPKGRVKYQSCLHTWKIIVDLEYY